ncbi:DALR anticodon-binding domain-containing protein 3 [Anopheles bellator]|uniref:DALR anticodon-binding domain-containing protein 3 n=1 Tax=Anopheles bellator TaxID=139047 RepID=UPI00264930AB|nr:DALR anticodon-binding domain-containing protein 3 [Anopheles bellator]
MDVLLVLKQNLTDFLRSEGYPSGFAIKFLDRNLGSTGDVLIKHGLSTELLLNVKRLLRESIEWPLPVERVSLAGNAAQIWFQRAAAYRWGIKWCQSGEHAHSDATVRPTICLNEPLNEHEPLSMREFRENALRKVLRNCFLHNRYQLVTEQDLKQDRLVPQANVTQIDIVHRINKMQRTTDRGERKIEILCGPVLLGPDIPDAAQYIARRSNDMQLIAQHKYGLGRHQVDKLQPTIASLGRSAAIVDVLQSRHSNTIDMRHGTAGSALQSSSKGASFILYNYARLAALFTKYARFQQINGYPELPSIDEVDFTLLTEPEEWQLFYVYVIGLPAILRYTLGNGQLENLGPHRLLEFTTRLVSCLSKYYRQTRIITENRPKLLPVMMARMHLLRCVYDTLDTLLQLIDLEPVREM